VTSHRACACRLELTANSHFSGIPVNTSRSSVHVPTNVFDGEPKVINAIDWSKKLDDTFKVSVKKYILRSKSLSNKKMLVKNGLHVKNLALERDQVFLNANFCTLNSFQGNAVSMCKL
jgi:hypothetical protein